MNDYGVAQYTILPSGDLHGLWVHAGDLHRSTEIAIKTSSQGGIIGTYSFSYIENGSIYIGTLRIADHGSVLTFQWEVGGEIWFEGTGMLTDTKSIAVAYRDMP